MSVQLNHTIVFSRDKRASAAFLREILGLPPATQFGPFLAVQITNVELSRWAAEWRASGRPAGRPPVRWPSCSAACAPAGVGYGLLASR
jgi:hypothetical protein